jgi:hypothetical protein
MSALPSKADIVQHRGNPLCAKADICTAADNPIHLMAEPLMSALPPKADIAEHRRNVRFVPLADIAQPLADQAGLGSRHAKRKRDDWVGSGISGLPAVPRAISASARSGMSGFRTIEIQRRQALRQVHLARS